jgi:putative hydrolase of the HAD superfamily
VYTTTKHIFFDLDNTLWDFENNSKKTIFELIQEFKLSEKCRCLPAAFYKTYLLVNEDLWALYRKNAITKEQLRSSRFTNTMLYFGHDDQSLGLLLEENYILRSPQQKGLVEGTIEILEYLSTKYQLHIITNGFKEIQHIKIGNCNLKKYFKNIFISEEIGCNKPNPGIFEFALNHLSALKSETIMIGDDWDADILGAQQFGMSSIYFSRKPNDIENKLVPQINNLLQLKEML